MTVAAELSATTVSDLMSRPVLTVETTESLWDAWQLLFVSGLRHLAVIDPQGCLVGTISDRNILSDVPMSPAHLSDLHVGDVMPRFPLRTIAPGRTPTEAATVMTAERIEALPVVEDGRLLGIITSTDLVHWLGAPAKSA